VHVHVCSGVGQTSAKASNLQAVQGLVAMAAPKGCARAHVQVQVQVQVPTAALGRIALPLALRRSSST